MAKLSWIDFKYIQLLQIVPNVTSEIKYIFFFSFHFLNSKEWKIDSRFLSNLLLFTKFFSLSKIARLFQLQSLAHYFEM